MSRNFLSFPQDLKKKEHLTVWEPLVYVYTVSLIRYHGYHRVMCPYMSIVCIEGFASAVRNSSLNLR